MKSDMAEEMNGKLLFLMDVMHDEEYRKKDPDHICDSWLIYPDGKWYCHHMVRSRRRLQKALKSRRIPALPLFEIKN